MNIHDQAWKGFKILILAKEPLKAARLEQAIATASPATEVQLSSFETYDQAYKFCKQQRDVGFFLIHEECGESSFLSVFRELGAQFSNDGTPAFGAILYDGEPKAFAERAIGKNPHLVDYIPSTDIISGTQTAEILNTTWNRFVDAFETAVFSKNLQDSCLSVAEEGLGTDGVHFIVRLTINLISELNITWLETIAMKWAPILQEVRAASPAILKPHPQLNRFLEICALESQPNPTALLQFLQGNTPLAKKATFLVNYLEKHRKNGSLESELKNIVAWNKAGAPKLVRHLAKHQERILAFQTDASTFTLTGS